MSDVVRQQCAEMLEGPRAEGTGRHIVTWRRQCRRLADPNSERCWQHRLDRNDIWRAKQGRT